MFITYKHRVLFILSLNFRALKENSAGNKGGSSLAARDDGPGEFTPCLLNKSHSQWAHSAGQGGPLSKSHLSAAEAIAPVNGESLKNEEELKKQLELIQDHLFGLKAEMNALQRTVRTQGPDRSRGGGIQSGAGVLKHSSGGSSPPGSDQSVGGAAVSDREWKAALSDLSRNLRRVRAIDFMISTFSHAIYCVGNVRQSRAGRNAEHSSRRIGPA